MTTLGKILVFVLLFFSFLVGGMVVVMFITTTNYRSAADKNAKLAQVINADREAWKARAEKAEEDKAGAEAKLNGRIRQLEEDYKKADEARVAAYKVKDDAEAQLTTVRATVGQLQAEQKRREGEVRELGTQVAGLRDNVNKLTEERKHLTDRANTAELNFSNEKERNLHLLDQLQTVSADLARVRASGGATGGASATPNGSSMYVKSPPPEDVRGIIKAIDADSGLLTISLGSDHGISRNHTLEVYRLKPKPTYLGTIRIVDVRPHEAVAKLVPSNTARRTPLQVGDEVASDVVGRR